MNNDLTPRLQALCDLVEPSKTVADIGCDHGLLSVFLAQSGRAETVWASDVSAPSLQKAQKLSESCGCANIRFFLGSGFDPLPGKPDVAVMAGFGARTMAPLLAHSFAQTDLILQPMCDSFVLYDAFEAYNFRVKSVRIVREEKRFYEIISAAPGTPEPFDHTLVPPDKLVKDDAALAFLRFREKQTARLLSKARDGRDTQARQNELNRQLNRIKEMLALWQL